MLQNSKALLCFYGYNTHPTNIRARGCPILYEIGSITANLKHVRGGPHIVAPSPPHGSILSEQEGHAQLTPPGDTKRTSIAASLPGCHQERGGVAIRHMIRGGIHAAGGPLVPIDEKPADCTPTARRIARARPRTTNEKDDETNVGPPKRLPDTKRNRPLSEKTRDFFETAR